MKYALIPVLLLLVFQKVEAMSIFDLGKVCVFSEVRARLTKNGDPMKHVKVIRRWEWNELQEDSTTTDEQGYFTFPAIYERSLSRMLPMELVIAQGLYVIDGEEEKKIWSNSKREPDENAEFGGNPIELSCEITDEMQIYRDFGPRMRTLCKWKQ